MKRTPAILAVACLATLTTGCSSSSTAQLDRQIATLRDDIALVEQRRDVECMQLTSAAERAACVREAQREFDDLTRQLQTLQKQRDDASRPVDLGRPPEPGRI